MSSKEMKEDQEKGDRKECPNCHGKGSRYDYKTNRPLPCEMCKGLGTVSR